MVRLIMFSTLIVLGFKSITANPEVIKEVLTNSLFLGAGVLVFIFGLGILKAGFGK
jgi:hypothetical protein